MNFIISIVLFVLLIFPQTASAVYYDRAGNPVPSNPVPISSSYKKKTETYPRVGIKLSDRKRSTQEYNYIIDNGCNINAVNLYRGETLYTCPNNIQFWSNVNIDPSPISLNTKNRSKAIDEESSDILMMSSSSAINVMAP
jgi:hypothetical protein